MQGTTGLPCICRRARLTFLAKLVQGVRLVDGILQVEVHLLGLGLQASLVPCGSTALRMNKKQDEKTKRMERKLEAPKKRILASNSSLYKY